MVRSRPPSQFKIVIDPCGYTLYTAREAKAVFGSPYFLREALKAGRAIYGQFHKYGFYIDLRNETKSIPKSVRARLLFGHISKIYIQRKLEMMRKYYDSSVSSSSTEYSNQNREVVLQEQEKNQSLKSAVLQSELERSARNRQADWRNLLQYSAFRTNR